MDILLDTHAAIWFITDDNKLPSVSKNLIENKDNTCYVSIATLWEMGIKYSLGKLELKTELKKIFELFLEIGLLLMPITRNISCRTQHCLFITGILLID